MCPFRVLVIFFSLLIALFATMAALAKDPEEEEREALARGEAVSADKKKSAWAYFVDFWSGRYLYRESKKLMPWFFSKNEDDEAEEEVASADNNVGAGEKDELAKAVAEAEAALAEHSGANDDAAVAASAQQLLQDQPGMPEPSAPYAEDDGVDVAAAAGSAERPLADAAFERALLSKRKVQHQQQPSLRDASIAAVIS
jgi:Na+-transporting methylmalonyl-CoA/oxaloacetate decarboxylase gamma subunit